MSALADKPDDSHPPRIPQVAERMKGFVESRQVAGAVTLVAGPDEILHQHAVGLADIANKPPMAADTLFWIASMTKPITATALLMLQDDGKLSIDDPVARHIPELANLKTADGKAAAVTLRQLLTHTSGMAEISPDQARPIKTLAELVPLYVAKPLGFEPGTRWVYCQSSINTAARVVEVVSGKSFVDFLDERLFGPLKMSDTTFYLSEKQHARLAKSYKRNTAGELEETANFILLGKNPTNRDRFPAANGGLFSTAGDYARFCQMLLHRGELDSRRYLKPDSVELMTSVQTGELKTGFTDGNGWGLGWCVVRKPQGVSDALSAGSFGHGGAYGTQAWIDPHKRRAYILMVQRADFPNADNSDVRREFQKAAAEALGKK
jgi:CubicO group peptidase (beta-lactamase class C family)